MRDKIHDIDLRSVDAKTVCEVGLYFYYYQLYNFCAILLKYVRLVVVLY